MEAEIKQLDVDHPIKRPKNAKDLAGKRFGKLTALRWVGVDKRYHMSRWLCQCDCGTEKIVKASSLRSGKRKSCGCLVKSKRKKITSRGFTKNPIERQPSPGEKFGSWTVIAPAEKTKAGKAQYLCKCDCGTEKVVLWSDLYLGKKKSCGCLTAAKQVVPGARFGSLTVVIQSGNHPQSNEPMYFCCCDCGKTTVALKWTLAKGCTTSCGHCAGRKAIDITGKRFGRLVAIRRVPGTYKWLFRCDYGNEKEISSHSVRSGATKSCGCLKKKPRHIKQSLPDGKLKKYKRGEPLSIGERFGKLTVIALAEKHSKHGKKQYLCKCDCGNEKETDASALRTGSTKSCGCLKGGIQIDPEEIHSKFLDLKKKSDFTTALKQLYYEFNVSARYLEKALCFSKSQIHRWVQP